MSSAIVKRIILGLLLIFFSFYLGSSAAEGLKSPVLVFAGIGFLFIMNWLGQRSWVLIFLAPVVMPFLPLGPISKISPGYLAATLVLVYYVVLSVMGYVRLKWKPLPFFDFLVLLVLLLFITQYIRFPIGVNGLGAVNGQVGGNDYITCVFATMFYVALSCISIPFDKLVKVLKWAMFTSVAFTLFRLVYGLATGATEASAEDVETSRFGLLAPIGDTIFLMIICFNRPLKILFSLWKGPLLLVSVVCVLLSGFRGRLVQMVFYFMASCWVYKQRLVLIFAALMAYGCLLVLNSNDVLQSLPHGIQRAISVVPGMDIDDKISADADYSMEWRLEMWEDAMDPRTGYIKDYVWGDGYGLDVDLFRLNNIAISRGSLQEGSNETYKDYGVWHSGYIHLIHRMGYVGLVIMGFVMFCIAVFGMRVCCLYRGHPALPMIMFPLIVIPGRFIGFFASAGETPNFFRMYYALAVAKIMYIAYKEGAMGDSSSGVHSSDKYIPMMLREDTK